MLAVAPPTRKLRRCEPAFRERFRRASGALDTDENLF